MPAARVKSWSTSTTVMPSSMTARRSIDRVDRHRREAERELVQEQQPRVGDQRAANRGGLLLAARQRRQHAGLAAAASNGNASSTVSTSQRPRGRGAPRDEQVLLDGQAREQAPALGNERDPQLHAAMAARA